MAVQDYRPRVIDEQLVADLESVGAVVVEGPKACGKSRTGERLAASIIRLDADPGRLAAAQIDPALVLDGPAPRLLDEWQLVPELWNAVRRAVDDRGGTGLFILTGSAMPADDARRHSGAGRMAVTRMRTMSLWEMGASTGTVSLAALLEGEPARGKATQDVPAYITLLVRGGWPETVELPTDRTRRFLRGYLDLVVERDIPQLDRGRRDPARLRRFLRAYAELTAHPVSLAAIVKRALGTAASAEDSAATLTWHTADRYLDAAQRLMLVEDLPAWSPALRSRTTLTELPKRHLVDPALAVALLGADEKRLLDDLSTVGYLFESMVTRDLRVYAQAADAAVFHYRERSGDLEIDLVVERSDGTWLGVEVKLGAGQIDSAATALRRLADSRIERPPASLVVVTTGEYAYRRPDGVDVVPLGALRP